MEKQLKIEIRDKVATLISQNFNLVGGNSDYKVVFDFDKDWESYTAKTAVFVYGKGKPIYKVFDGNVCKGIAIENTTMCLIGVFAGDIVTTTPACVECVRRSILDEANGTPEEPTNDVYNQIMDLLNRYINAVKGAPSGGKAGQVLKKNSDQDYDYSWQDDEMRDLTNYYTKKESDDKFATPSIVESKIKEYMDANPPKDGFSPKISVTEIDNGHRVEITDIDGIHTFDVMNGEKGEQGEVNVLQTTGDSTTAVMSQKAVTEALKEETSVLSDGVLYGTEKEFIDGRLKITFKTDKTLDNVAIAGKTYRELFEGEFNLLPELNFDNNSFAPFIVINGTPIITREAYYTKPYSLKVFGDSSQNIYAEFITTPNRYYFMQAKVRVDRYVRGNVGIHASDGATNVIFQRLTDGFESRSRIILNVSHARTYFIGSWDSADLDAYIDNVCFVDITDFYGQFANVTEANQTMQRLYDEYTYIKNASESFFIDTSLTKTEVTGSATECINAFLAYMNEKAIELQMDGSYFASPHGRIKTSYSTPQDLLKLGVVTCGYEDATRIWGKRSITFDIHGLNARTLTLNSGSVNGTAELSVYYNFLGGKGGSLIWGSNDTDYHRAQCLVLEVEDMPTVVALMGNGIAAYNNIYTSAKEVADLVKAKIKGETAVEGDNIANLITTGGGYAACVLPSNASLYSCNYAPSKLISKNYAVSNSPTVSRMPASTSKIMTMICALDYMTNPYEILTIKNTDITSGSGSTYYAGDQMRFIDALTAMMLESSNTLATAISRFVGKKILQSKTV